MKKPPVLTPIAALRRLTAASKKVDRIHAPAELFEALTDAEETLRHDRVARADAPAPPTGGSSVKQVNHSRLAHLVKLSEALITSPTLSRMSIAEVAQLAEHLLQDLEERARV